MMDRCPNCRARLDTNPQCRRCGMELDLLRQVERGFDIALARALVQVAAGDPKTTGMYLRQALALRTAPLPEQILALLETDSGRHNP